MSLHNKTRKQLQKICKEKGLKNFWSWDKNKMVRAINKAEFEQEQREKKQTQSTDGDDDKETTQKDADRDSDNQEQNRSKEVEAKKTETKQLTPQAKKWKEYFDATNTSAEQFLERYPNHKFRKFIQELT